jgi:Uma2 family endonuclease
MSVSRRWTVADLEQIEPKETERYEIIDGELVVTHAPSWRHQFPCSQLNTALEIWSGETGRGTTFQVPGLVFSQEDAVIPDIVWSSWDRLWAAEDRAGHFTLAPELVVEIVSPGSENERRDRQTKLALYSRRGVDEYWIVDWQRRTVDVYRRATGGLELVQTLGGDDILESPLLPGFRLELARIWPPTRRRPA